MGILESVNKIAEKLQDAARASEAPSRVDPTQSTIGLDPAETGQYLTRQLLDLTIPKGLREWLTKPLQELGFTVESLEIPGRFGSASRTYDVVKNGAGQCSIFHIAKQVLQDGSSWEAVGNVITAIQMKNQVLLIVSEGLDAAHVAYSVVVEPLWLNDFQIHASFVPWRHLQEIKLLGENDQLLFLPKVLKLEELLTKARETMPLVTVKEEEILKIANILALLPQFIEQPEKSFRLLFSDPALKPLVTAFSFDGQPKEIGLRIMGLLVNYKPLREKPNHQVLGLFLQEVLKLPEIRPDDSTYITGIITTYRLVPG